jgi:hypothetical protein
VRALWHANYTSQVLACLRQHRHRPLARAAPDGYTLAVGTGDQFVINGAIYALQYDVVKDFEPVTLLASIGFLMCFFWWHLELDLEFWR